MMSIRCCLPGVLALLAVGLLSIALSQAVAQIPAESVWASPRGAQQVMAGRNPLPADVRDVWIGESDRPGARLGATVAAIGDVNGDGFSDLIVGAPGDGLDFNGTVFVYHGSSAGLRLHEQITMPLTGVGEGARFGATVASGGDVDGDGVNDAIIGAPDYRGLGVVFVYRGGGATLSLKWVFSGTHRDAHFGAVATTVGDVNGDGFGDIAISAPGAGPGGVVFLYPGGPDGPLSVGHVLSGTQPGEMFGAAVAPAGDVNGDGYADLAIGAPGYDLLSGTLRVMDAGRVCLYYGAPAGPLFDGRVDCRTDELPVAQARFGAAVSTAGDLNGDGYADLAVGAPGADVAVGTLLTEAGRVTIYAGGSAGLSPSPGWDLVGDQTGAHFGASLSFAGDLNDNGYADLIVAAPDADGDAGDEGELFVFTGGPDGPAATPSWSVRPTAQMEAHFGEAVATAGDVNGDGYADFAVGAPGYDHGQTDEGGVFVYHGQAGPPGSTPAWQVFGAEHAFLGWSAANAGDVNGDGYDDVLVGAPKYSHGQEEEGGAFLYLGGPGGPDSIPAWTGEGEQDWAWYGQAVAAAGDVNGDGYGDVIVGAPRYDNAWYDDGRAFIYYGGPAGLTHEPVWTAPPETQGSAVFGASARFGTAVGAAGDVNGDGYGDVIVTANGYDGEAINEGAAFVYYGGPDGPADTPAWMVHPTNQPYANFGRSAASAGDVNGDGYGDVIIGAPWLDHPGSTADDHIYDGAAFVYYGGPDGLGGEPAWRTTTLFDNAEFGIAVAPAGDVNGDGFSDVIVGAYKYIAEAWREGAACVYLGGATGLNADVPDVCLHPTDQKNAKFGLSVTYAGDINGDGYSDVVVGAPGYTGGTLGEDDVPAAGAVYAYTGGPSGLSPDVAWRVVGDQRQGAAGFSVAGGDVNGDGNGDVIVGVPAYNPNGYQLDGGTVRVYPGNSGGRSVRPLQLQPDADGQTPIALGGRAYLGGVHLQMDGRSPLGRTPMRLQWELAPFGVPFTATGVSSGQGPLRSVPPTAHLALSQTITALLTDTLYHWRVRAAYPAGDLSGRVAGRWYVLPGNGPQEADFRTPLTLTTATQSAFGAPLFSPIFPLKEGKRLLLK